jgi:Flp pilus assembly pilin Flp
MNMPKLVKRLIKDEKGVTAIEYAVIGVLVIGVVGLVGFSFITDLFDDLAATATNSS